MKDVKPEMIKTKKDHWKLFLKGGGQLSKVEDKYRISKEVKELLTK